MSSSKQMPGRVGIYWPPRNDESQPYANTLCFRLCPCKSAYNTTSRSWVNRFIIDFTW